MLACSMLNVSVHAKKKTLQELFVAKEKIDVDGEFFDNIETDVHHSPFLDGQSNNSDLKSKQIDVD